jgi:hypothetical protein
MDKREGFIERIVHRIERHVEEVDVRRRVREEELEHYRETPSVGALLPWCSVS